MAIRHAVAGSPVGHDTGVGGSGQFSRAMSLLFESGSTRPFLSGDTQQYDHPGECRDVTDPGSHVTQTDFTNPIHRQREPQLVCLSDEVNRCERRLRQSPMTSYGLVKADHDSLSRTTRPATI